MYDSRFHIGDRVRFNEEAAKLMGRFGTDIGVVVPPPIGSTREIPGGLYVRWGNVREPNSCFCFEDDLELVQ